MNETAGQSRAGNTISASSLNLQLIYQNKYSYREGRSDNFRHVSISLLGVRKCCCRSPFKHLRSGRSFGLRVDATILTSSSCCREGQQGGHEATAGRRNASDQPKYHGVRESNGPPCMRQLEKDRIGTKCGGYDINISAGCAAVELREVKKLCLT